jgi:transposase-like protein
VVFAISLTHTAITAARGWAVNSPLARVRLAGEADALRSQVAMLETELGLLRARLERVPARTRPHFTAVERLQILQLKAARCWSQIQVARRLLLAPSTVDEWLARFDEGGEQALLRVPVPVNRFPDFVGHLVQQLAALKPTIGKVRIAQVLPVYRWR